eukprot:Stramenopile-MAST_4_protein_3033
MDSYANTKLDICHSGGRGTEWDENALSEKRFDKISITHNKPETLMKTECIFFLFWLVLATASVEEPGEKMIGATFEQEFPKEGVLTAKVTEYTPPKNNKGADLADVETKGLYKVVFSDGDFGQYYYSDLLKHGAKVPVDGNSEL